VQNSAFVLRRWMKSLDHPYLPAGLRIPHSLVLSMARFRLSSHNLGVKLGRQKGVVWLCVAASVVQLWECTIFLWTAKPIYSFYAQLPLCLGIRRRFAQMHFTLLQDLMCCRGVYVLALFVHKCMKIADAASAVTARQPPKQD
jgi:hypothetical protein